MNKVVKEFPAQEISSSQEAEASARAKIKSLDELVDTLPEGAYLTQVAQQGRKVDLEGRAQSNARVSAYMRNIDASGWLGQATLNVIENRDKTGTGLSHFKLAANQKNTQGDQQDNN